MIKLEKSINPGIAVNTGGYDIAKISERELMKELKRLDDGYKTVKSNRLNEYSNSLPESLNLERKTFDGLSDEEIANKAEDYLSYDYETGKSKLLDSIEATRNKIYSNKDKLNDQQRTSLEELDKNFNAVKERISNESLKRGLGRSSIVVNRITDADIKRAEQAGIIENKVAASILQLNAQLEELESNKANSLKAYDLNHAVKLTKEIDKLTAERDKLAKDVIEYNNKLSKEEAKYQEDRSKKIEDYKYKLKREDISDEEYYKKNGYYPNMAKEYDERYSLAYDFYSKLPVETAKRVLNENPDLEKYLGAKNYNKLKTVIVMRKG